jgi:hypothetical protein
LGHLSSGVVSVAQFNPWQAHVIVVDACAFVLEMSPAAFEAMSRSRSLLDESEIFGVE